MSAPAVSNNNPLRHKLNRAELERVLARFFAAPPTIFDFKPNNKGKNNQIYIVNTSAGRLVVHLSNPLTNMGQERTPEDIAYVFDFQEALAAEGLPLPRRYRTLEGESHAKISFGKVERDVTLQSFVEGASPRYFNPAQLAELGRLVARLHQVARTLTLPPPPTRSWSMSWFIEQNVLGKLWPLSDESNLPDSLRPYLEELNEAVHSGRAFVSPRLEQFQKYPVHGDICGPNLLYQGDDLAAILDFDNCHSDYFCEDLTVPLLNHCALADAAATRKMVHAFLDSYSQNGALSSLELEMALHGWLAFYAWFAFMQLSGDLKAENFNEPKTLAKARTIHNKLEAIRQVILKGI